MKGPSYWSLGGLKRSGAEATGIYRHFIANNAMGVQRATGGDDEDGDGGLSAPPTIPHNVIQRT